MPVQRSTLSYLIAAIVVVALGALVVAQWDNDRRPPTAASSPAADAGGRATGDSSTSSAPAAWATAFRNIADAQMPMVVSIRTVAEREVPTGGPFGDQFRRFFGMPEGPQQQLVEGAGSGFIIDGAGLVLTNAHVVENAERIEVALFPDPKAAPGDIRRFDAKVLGRDRLTDSALVQIEGQQQLPVARLGDSAAMHPGDWVMAIGNPFALSHTVTVGVVSAIGRPFPVEGRPQRMLQTDAAVNPGNSGGPLLNVRGEVVGMNTAIYSPNGMGGNVGIGFAVPINALRDLLPKLRQGDVHRGQLGVSIRDIPSGAAQAFGLDAPRGALVSAVEPNSAASRAGIRPGDVIVEFSGEAVDDADELVRLVSNASPSTEARIVLLRDSQRQTVTATLSEIGQSASGRSSGEPADAGQRFGLSLTPITPDVARRLGASANQAGAVVADVAPGSAAAEAGLAAGDVILEVNRTAVHGVDETVSQLRSTPDGTPAFLLVSREGREMFLVLTPR